MKVALLLLAAGRGTRFGGPVPKAFLPLSGRAVLVHSATRLCAVADPRRGEAQLLVAVHPDDRDTHLAPCLPALRALAECRLVDGGATRQESMQRALAAADPDCDVVLIHDAARPLFPIAAARACVEAARRVGAAVLAVPAADTLKLVRAGRVERTLPRDGVWLAQTPQVVRRDLLARAVAAAPPGDPATDDVGLVERLGAEVAVVESTAGNLKITRPEDLPLAEALLRNLPTT